MARKRLYDEIEHISNLFGPVFNTAVHGAVTPSRLSKGKENCIFRWDNSRRNVVNKTSRIQFGSTEEATAIL